MANTESLLAYPGGQKSKGALLAQIAVHRKADEIIKGVYWKDGKGCAIGCSLHSSDHMVGQERYGIPVMLWRLEDCIFEGLPNAQAKEWPERFAAAFEPGRDYGLVGWKLLHWLLTDPSVSPGIDHPLVCDAVKQCAEVIYPLTKGEQVGASARSAARSAESAAWSAARSAARRSESAAWSAARSAESAVESAAGSAWGAAWSAPESAARSAAESARSAAGSAWGAAYIQMADKLIGLIKIEDALGDMS